MLLMMMMMMLLLLFLGKNSQGIKILSRTMTNSIPALSILLAFSLIGIVFFGAVIFFFEEGSFVVNTDYPNGEYLRPSISGYTKEASTFDSILVSMYWTVTTITTVGYGDYVPTTYAGRFVAVIAIYCGVFVFALPISVIGSNFSKEMDHEEGQNAETVADCLSELVKDYDFKVGAVAPSGNPTTNP